MDSIYNLSNTLFRSDMGTKVRIFFSDKHVPGGTMPGITGAIPGAIPGITIGGAMPGMTVGYIIPIWSVFSLFGCNIRSTSSPPDFPKRKRKHKSELMQPGLQWHTD